MYVRIFWQIEYQLYQNDQQKPIDFLIFRLTAKCRVHVKYPAVIC